MNGLAKLRLFIELKENLNKGLDAAHKKITKATGNIQSKLNDFKVKNVQAFDAITSRVPGVGSALGALANPYTLIAAAAGVAITMGIKATQMANDWHTKMAEINVTAELTKKQLGSLSDKILDIGSRSVRQLEEVPDAFNRIISAGLSTNQSLEALEPTLRAAKAGFADIETVASAGVSTMMSSGENAIKVYDILFETVKEGNAEFRDIARYLPKIIPLARNVGFALDETAGAFASLTGKLSAEQSTTALEGIMRSLSNNDIVKRFESMKIQVFDKDTNQVRPILEIMKDLDKQMSGLTDKQRMLKFDQLGLDQMSTLGFSTLIQDINGLEKAINATVNSQGALDKAYRDSLTPMESWKIIQNQLKVEMIKIGEAFLPVISKIGNGILGIINYFKNLYKESELFRDILHVVGSAFEWAFKIAIIPIKAVINYIKIAWKAIFDVTDALNGWFEKITGIKGGFKSLYDYIRPYLIWIKEFISEISNIFYDMVTFNFKGVKEKIQNFKMPDIGEIKHRVKVETEDDHDELPDGAPITPTGNGNPIISGNPVDNINSIKNGSQTKNVTVNIDSFVKGFTPTHQSINGMSKDELERWMTEMLLRVVRSAETAI
ncbi:phage tail tape measure protein [Proteiniphilum sp.]|uniref:phage tail tape measure protein n=1 Tax=Proteiniphilum sp. TaxID=1926877 RepID=UPI002B1EBD6D|nr:phage tail tape measure protein [Proteiniphilum sp.]MEA4916557.1 phage tail tape measure protein [Proteiniphilum sp.]